MQRTQLYLNDGLADLSDDSPIALTFQINNLADVANQVGNTSNQFKIPNTQNNRRLCGFPDDIRITNNIPYTQLKAKIIQNGIEVIPLGIGEVTSADEGSISLTVLSGNVDFFDLISEQIYNLGDSTNATGVSGLSKPMAPYNHIWNLDNAVNSRTNTTGYIYPVIDYGGLPQIAPFTVNVRNLRPAFFLKTMIDIIIGITGYKATGNLLSDPLYNKLLVPFANDSFDHGTDYQQQPDELGLIAYSNSDQGYVKTLFAVGNIGNLNFNNISSDPNNQFNGQIFTAKQIFSATVLVTIPKFYFMGRTGDNNQSTVDIQIFLHTPAEGEMVLASYNYDLNGFWTRVPGTSGSEERGYYTTNVTQKISADVDLNIGYQIYVRWQFYGGRPESFTMYSGATIQITAKNQNVLFGQELQTERIFPDISQKDLLKDTLQRFAIICQTDNTNKTVNFISLKDIIKKIPIAKDWSKKCLNVGKQNNFVLGANYAQVNQLLYKQDDAILNGYADDVININDKTLSTTPVQLIQSQFAPSLNAPFAGGSTAQILKIDVTGDSDDFTIGTQPRILVDNKVNLFTTGQGMSVTFIDGNGNSRVVNDVISCPYFYKTGGAFNLMWKDNEGSPGLRSLYYKELQNILNQTKLVTRYFLLTPRDIAEIDLTIPIYLEQDNAYFYINQVYQWVRGVACKVQLVKLGEI